MNYQLFGRDLFKNPVSLECEKVSHVASPSSISDDFFRPKGMVAVFDLAVRDYPAYPVVDL